MLRLFRVVKANLQRRTFTRHTNNFHNVEYAIAKDLENKITTELSSNYIKDISRICVTRQDQHNDKFQVYIELTNHIDEIKECIRQKFFDAPVEIKIATSNENAQRQTLM